MQECVVQMESSVVRRMLLYQALKTARALDTHIHQATESHHFLSEVVTKKNNTRLLDSPGAVWTAGVSSGDGSRHGAT